MTRWLEATPGKPLPLDGCSTEQVHVFDERSIRAVNAALAARRPLLVRGEPGTGKSQLALAVATALCRPYLPHVVDSHTTAQELLWSFDAVARLAEAQLAGALGQRSEAVVRAQLDVKRFVTPGPLWWALDWANASRHIAAFGGAPPRAPKGWDQSEPPVVLIDEIDKADSDVPNGLLEVLGSGCFKPQGYPEPIAVHGKVPPLVVITTNEERALPDAFLRRCMVLHLTLPKDRAELVEFLVARGRAHFQTHLRTCAEGVLRAAANQLVQDRAALQARRLPAPGQAEYLDLVRAVTELAGDEARQLELLDEIAPYALQKHPEGSRA